VRLAYRDNDVDNNNDDDDDDDDDNNDDDDDDDNDHQLFTPTSKCRFAYKSCPLNRGQQSGMLSCDLVLCCGWMLYEDVMWYASKNTHDKKRNISNGKQGRERSRIIPPTIDTVLKDRMRANFSHSSEICLASSLHDIKVVTVVYSGVTVLSQWCYSGVPGVSQWCHSSVKVNAALVDRGVQSHNQRMQTGGN
jgi:hypothetical protein